jgi:flagellar motor protein MotB
MRAAIAAMPTGAEIAAGTPLSRRSSWISKMRAEAVVEVLVSDYGVFRERLTSAGVGPHAPTAPNRTDEGRSKNRRAELVEQC